MDVLPSLSSITINSPQITPSSSLCWKLKQGNSPFVAPIISSGQLVEEEERQGRCDGNSEITYKSEEAGKVKVNGGILQPHMNDRPARREPSGGHSCWGLPNMVVLVWFTPPPPSSLARRVFIIPPPPLRSSSPFLILCTENLILQSHCGLYVGLSLRFIYHGGYIFKESKSYGPAVLWSRNRAPQKNFAERNNNEEITRPGMRINCLWRGEGFGI